MWQRQWMSYLIFLHCTCWGSIHGRRLRLLPTVHYYCCCFLSITLKMYLQPQHNAVNPLALLSLLRPRLMLPFLHLSPIAGIRGAAVGICPPRWNLPCNLYLYYYKYIQVLVLSRYPETMAACFKALGSQCRYSMYCCCCIPQIHALVPIFCRPLIYQDKHDRFSKTSALSCTRQSVPVLDVLLLLHS